MLETETLAGRTFVDEGSGSGLFSLAARRMSARVHSFDYDPTSVRCTAELKRRYFPDDEKWTVEGGSVGDLLAIRHIARQRYTPRPFVNIVTEHAACLAKSRSYP